MNIFAKCASFTRPLELMAAGLYPYFTPISENLSPEVLIGGRRVIMAGSNNYLGLTHHPQVKEAAARAIQKFGTSCTGSRLLNGTIDLHLELEERLSRFLHREAALVFSTGFQTNLGAIAALVSKDDAAFIDRENHASIIDGCRLSFGTVYKFKHQDMAELDRMLEEAGPSRGKLIVVDGVFSMRGDIVDLPRLAKVASAHDAAIFMDDAHGIGVLGAHGRGTAEHFGMEDRVDLVMGTFSKSLASLGGFIAGKEEVIRYVKHFSRALIFSASIPPSSAAAALAALEVMEREPERRDRLWSHARKMKRGLDALGFDTCGSQTPIISVRIGSDEETFRFWKMLFDEGVFTNPIIPPAVPAGAGMIRTSYMATHTEAQLDRILEIFEKLGRQFGLLRQRASAPAP